jgi:EmrB/QacA subfamily drug resistance transporter
MVSVLGRSVPYKYIVAFVYVSALFVDILDVTIVNVALPTLGREMRSDAIEWIVLGYTLSLAVWIPASGWLGDRVGTKRIFLTAVGLFVGASMLCGLAQNIEQLIAFRVLQGVGGGMLTPVGVAMLYRAYPPAERAKAATVLIIPTVLAPATGPVLGGLLVTHLHWRWIFFINVPIGLMAFVVAARYLREHREPSAKHFDWRGFVLSGAGLALVVFALSEGPRAGWTSGLVLITGVIGVVAFVLMVWVELTVPNPMLDLRLLREPIFRVTNIVSMLAQGAFLGVIFLMPLYLQDLRGVSALESGLTTFPQAFGVMAASQISGRIYPRIGPRRLIMAGMAAGTVSGLLFGLVDLGTSMWAIRGLMLLRGFCLGIAFVPMQAASYAQIQPQDNGRASSIFATGRQMAVSLSIAALATVVTTVVPFDEIGLRPDDALDAFRLAFLVCAGFSALAVIASTRIRDELAANTMVRRR